MAKKKISTGRLAAVLLVVALISIAGGYSLFAYVLSPKKDSPARQTKTASDTAKKSSNKDSSQTTTVTSSSAEYKNDRYGFKTEQPVEWTQKTSQNADGVTLTSPDGKAVIRTYGFQNAEVRSMSEVYTGMEKDRRSMYPDLTVSDKVEGLIDGHPDIEAVWTYTDRQPDGTSAGQRKTKIVVTLKGESGLGLEYTALAADYATYLDVFSKMVAEYKLK